MGGGGGKAHPTKQVVVECLKRKKKKGPRVGNERFHTRTDGSSLVITEGGGKAFCRSSVLFRTSYK